MLKIAFVGVGSIATRHIKNVKTYLEENDIEGSIDVFRSGNGKTLSDEIKKIVSCERNINDAFMSDEHYDVVFITNPTSLHYDTLVKFQEHAEFFFIEKPVFSDSEADVSRLNHLDSKKCYVACPLRYNPVVSYIKENIDADKVVSVRAICSSYLPEWRPGTDYRKCYSAHKKMGGGVDIDLIHEWDYITYIFGDPTEGFAIREKVSDLEIDSNDIALYVAKNDKMTFEIHLDYFGRSSTRTIEIFMKDDTVICDIIGGTIEYKKARKYLDFNSERNSFQMEEIKHFFNIVLKSKHSDSTIEHAIKVLKLAEGDFR